MRIGPYETLEKIGAGGAGAVFRARAADGREVALKVLKEGRADGRVDREVRLLGSLGEEEGFVPLLDSGESPLGRWLAMPFLKGGTLRERMRAPMPLAEALELGAFLARTMATAHEKGIVHRDLKPENILFTGDGKPLIADLGLAKHWSRDASGAAESVSLSRPGEMRGTPGYMAPEQMTDAKAVGPPADVFAIGAILYECLTGVAAFTGGNTWAVLEKVESGKFEPLPSLRPDAPAWLASVIDGALDTDPGRRPRDGQALLAALAGKGVPRRRSVLLVAPALVLVLVLVLVLSRASSPSTSTSTSTETALVETRTPSAPGWFLAIPAKDRLDLPRGVVPSEKSGEYRNVKDGTTLLLVAAGPCRVFGFDENQHAVVLPAFLISKYELTHEQFRRFVAETGHRTTAEEKGGGFVWKPLEEGQDSFLGGYETVPGTSWKNPEPGARPVGDEPVTQVSYVDARAYCEWAGLTLPTEEEWEKAATWDGKRTRTFPWGENPPSEKDPRLANLGDLSFRRLFQLPLAGATFDDGCGGRAPVGTFELDRSPCGAMDMGGNASEWCSRKDPSDLAQRYRGGHFCAAAKDAAPGARDDITVATTSTDWVGFRPARRLGK